MARILTPFSLGSQVVRKQRAYTKDDLVKTKFVFRILFLVAFMAILSLFYIWSRVQIVQYGYEINELKARQHQLIEENKKLKVETATLKSPNRIEKIAREKLKMRAPLPEQVQIVPEKKRDVLLVSSQKSLDDG